MCCLWLTLCPDFATQNSYEAPVLGKSPAVSGGEFYVEEGADFSLATALNP